MLNLWKQFAGWGTGLRTNIPEIFSSARIRITLYYFTVGLVIVVGAGILVDTYITASIQQILGKIQEILTQQYNDPVTASTAVSLIVSDMRQRVWLVQLCMVAIMALSANILAGITLRPIRHTLEAQRRFVANASHELRTPLTVMLTNFEVALLDPVKVTKEEALLAIRENLEEVRRMTDMLQTLLSFSGYERRITGMLFLPVNLWSIAERVVRIMEVRAEKLGVHLVLGDRSDVIVRGNATALEEMILNLVKNALAFTPRGKTVHVDVERESAGVGIVSVRDEGPGIPPNDLPHIFEPFYRGANMETRRDGRGVGLGLAIVSEIVKLHRARVSAKSEMKAGTTFTVRLAAIHG